MKSQKNIFKSTEGDSWYNRNIDKLKQKNIEEDSLYKEIINLPFEDLANINILEIGCGSGDRLVALKKLGYNVFGVDPSTLAIDCLKEKNISGFVETADNLPFENEKFDVLIFGFCLYLCDREDLFKINFEADRVLKNGGYILILDFYSKENKIVDYHHYKGVKTYKMDYSKMFTWHPNYFLLKTLIGSHEDINVYTENQNDWISISKIKKIGFS